MSNLAGFHDSGKRLCKGTKSCIRSWLWLGERGGRCIAWRRRTYGIESGADEHQDSLQVVVPEPGLLLQLGVREERDGVDDGDEGGKARGHEDGQAERSPLLALQAGVEMDGGG